MSQISPVSGSSNDAHPSESRGSHDRKRPHVDEESSSVDGRESVRSRRLSWNLSGPVEPPLKSAQPRSIGVHSILNHPAKGGAGVPPSVESGREGLGDRAMNSPSHSRFSSSSTVHLPSPSMHPTKRPSLSPRSRNPQTIAPGSPSARFVSAGGYYPQKPGVSPSPLIHESLPQHPNSPLTVDSGHPTPMPGHQPPLSIHSTPTYRTSTNQTPNPSSKETSPTTPISAYSQLGRSSPAIAVAPTPQSNPFMNSSQYGAVDPASRLPPVATGQRHTGGDEAISMGGPQPENAPLPGMIPCFLDLKSGSSSQAEKRKANSDASRRFRNRKRNEMQMEQKITAQQEEIRKQTEAMQRQAQELRALREQRDFYYTERDFFREQYARLVPSGQLPTRPASPRPFPPQFDVTLADRDHKTATWPGPDMSRKIDTSVGSTGRPSAAGPLPTTSNVTALPTARSPGTWPAAGPSAQYPASQSDRVVLPDERQARQLHQAPGTWSRSFDK